MAEPSMTIPARPAPSQAGPPAAGREGDPRLYGQRVELDPEAIPRAEPSRHTMGGALDAYIEQRVPVRLLDGALSAGMGVEVHGILPRHVPAVLPTSARYPVVWPVPRPGKRFNRTRPAYFLVPSRNGEGDRLVVAVPPGHDYVRHYASLVHHYCRRRSGTAGGLRQVVYYPLAEREIARWTGLDALIEPGERVLLGYVDELTECFLRAGASVCDAVESQYYGCTRLRFPSGALVAALGVKFSFWGSLAARLAAACRRQGAAEVVYAGKLGALTGPGDVYGRLFVPSRYARYGSEVTVLDPRTAPPNPLLERHPGLDTGTHLSVGTVLEELREQRAKAARCKVTSIDNEISQMAAALATSPGARPTAFCAVHFATDYLYRAGETVVPGLYNLANHRSERALARKRAMLGQVADVLVEHYAVGLG